MEPTDSTDHSLDGMSVAELRELLVLYDEAIQQAQQFRGQAGTLDTTVGGIRTDIAVFTASQQVVSDLLVEAGIVERDELLRMIIQRLDGMLRSYEDELHEETGQSPDLRSIVYSQYNNDNQ